MYINMKTSEAQLRAIKNYRSKNREKIRALTRLYSKKYYSDPDKYNNHKEKMREKYKSRNIYSSQ